VDVSYKLNFDTAVRESFTTQFVVCRDSSGKIVKALSYISPPCDHTYGEALAAVLAISLAISLGLQNFTLEGDSHIVIIALQNPTIIQDWKIADISSNSISTISTSYSWKARKVHKSANFCAHHVVYWAVARVAFPLDFLIPPIAPICSGLDPLP
jgi:hypothetical protein